jgi:hypothetical protein
MASFGKKYGHKNFYLATETPKEEKKKIFDFPTRKNPILNPDSVKPTGKKITVRP